MKYVFVDTNNGGTPSNATPDTSTSKYHTSSVWPANGAQWSTIFGALNDATVRGLADDLTIFCRGTAADTTRPSDRFTGMSCTSMVIEGELTSAKWDTSKYRIEWATAGGYLIDFQTNAYPLTLRGLQIKHSTPTTGTTYLVFNGSTSQTLTIDSCFLWMASASTTVAHAVMQNTAGGTTTVYNCIVKNTNSTAGTGRRCFHRAAGTLNVYNSIARGAYYGFSGTITAKNCIAYENDDDFTGTPTLTTCAADDNDTGVSVVAPTWTDQFVDHSNDDYTLKSGGSLIGAGTDDPASGLFSDDIAGTTRSDWDIGPFEYVAATGLSITSVTPSSFDDGVSGIVIAGTGFGSSQGSSTLTIGGQAQTVANWSDTSITFTSVRGSNSMGSATLTLTKV